MDIEDLFKEEFADHKVAPASKSFTQLRIRHVAKKIGLYVLSGSMVVAMGIAGNYYFNQAEESTNNTVINTDAPSNSNKNHDIEKDVSTGNVNRRDVKRFSKNHTEPTKEFTIDQLKQVNFKKTKSTVKTEQLSATEQHANSKNAADQSKLRKNETLTDRKVEKEIQVKDKAKDTQLAVAISSDNTENKKLIVPEANQQEATKEKATAQQTENSKTKDAASVQNEKSPKTAINTNTEGVADEALFKNSSTIQDTEEIAAVNLNQENKKEKVEVPEKLNEALQPKEIINDSSTAEKVAIKEQKADSAQSNAILPKRKRKFKFTVGALYNQQFSTFIPYEYSGFYSFTLQAGIKYPLFKKKIQVISGIDYTASHHHFFSNGYREGIYDEVDEIHIFLRRLEIPLAVDYKLPISTPVQFRIGAGLKFSKIFTDDEEAFDTEGNIVVHPEPFTSFLVDELDPINTYKFVYLNVSKGIKKTRLNFQLQYYFTNYPMEGYSETFVSDYFSTSSLRIGLSLDF